MDGRIDVQACALKPLHVPHLSCRETHAVIAVTRWSPLGGLMWTLCNTCFQFAFVYAPFAQVARPFAITASVINPKYCGLQIWRMLSCPCLTPTFSFLHPAVSTLICGPREVSAGATCHGSPIRLMRHSVTALVIGWTEDAARGMFCQWAVRTGANPPSHWHSAVVLL